ncbi:lysozyme inhibitor [Citrobacter braakii]|uniref:Lysozyme inhibitor n=2 Tax=Citrobacter braakii TaxID=57706 RepID=A0AA44REL1_CITBR|nr:lysozyme inhibitor [Citrobacter braakii]
MKKLLLVCLPVLLSGCSVYNQFVERMQTDTLEYRCDEKPLTVKLNNTRQMASFVYDNQLLNLKQGVSASGARYTDGIYVFSGARYTDGIYVFWSKGDEATVYKRDRIVLNNCQLQNPKR